MAERKRWKNEKDNVFVPMIGELFSIMPHTSGLAFANYSSFRPHDWGAFFNEVELCGNWLWISGVFVPMIGELFSIPSLRMPMVSISRKPFAAGMDT